jgi:hypothetical protein
MNSQQAASVLTHWASTHAIDVQAVDGETYNLSPRGSDLQKQVFIRFSETNRNYAGIVHCFVISGVVTDSDALMAMLLCNRNGAADSEFFFSVSKQGGNLFALLEAKHIDARMDEEGLQRLLLNWWMNPVFILTWNFPSGVENFLWQQDYPSSPPPAILF